MDAQATQIAESAPQATATLSVTNTAVSAPATLTPIPTITPLVLAPTATVTPQSSGGSIISEYDCNAYIGKRPYDYQEMNPGETFDIKFTIENTGTATWESGRDLIHSYGPDFTNGQFPAGIELPEVKPGGQFSVGPYDATAPNEKGNYVMEFKLEGGFCWPVIAITVK